MSNPMIIWCVIAAALSLAFVFRAVEHFYLAPRRHKAPHHLFELSREREMFYIPGDVEDDEDELY